MKTILLLLLVSAASADTTVQPCDHARIIYERDIAPKSLNSFVEPVGDVCTITWTPKSGQTVAFEDKQAQRAAIVVELGGLEGKLDAGTIAKAELSRLIKILLKLVRLSKEQ